MTGPSLQRPRTLRQRTADLAVDLAAITGAASIVYGAGLIYRPASFIIAGAFLIVGAWLIARSGNG